MTSPNSGTGYDKSDREKGGNGYMPISLQYNDYTATYARNPSLAGGDPFENFTNRSYKGKSVKTANKQDMLSVLETKAKMKGKPVIVSLEMDKPTIMSEFEGSADAILVNFGVQNQAVLDIISGKAEPSALLPLQMPADMRIFAVRVIPQADFTVCGQVNLTPAGAVNIQWTQMLICKHLQ